MASPIFISRPPPGFSIRAIIRGLQLTVLGGYRALKNPNLIKLGYYQKAFQALIYSIAIQLILWAPFIVLGGFFRLLGMIFGSHHENNRHSATDSMLFIQNNILNVGPLLITLTRYTRPDMDELFYESLQWMDYVYKKKHPDSDREYYRPLMAVKPSHNVRRDASSMISRITAYIASLIRFTASPRSTATRHLAVYVQRYIRRSLFTAIVYFASGLPVIGRFVLPAVSFQSLNTVIGTARALEFTLVCLVIPRRYNIILLSAFWGGRSLVRELLSPYFKRLPFSPSAKQQWFAHREGILFGFGSGFFLLMKIPFIGVLVYGFAEASAAYLITKVTEPIPIQPSRLIAWTEKEAIWTSKDNYETLTTNDGFDNMPGSWIESEKSGKISEKKENSSDKIN